MIDPSEYLRQLAERPPAVASNGVQINEGARIASLPRVDYSTADWEAVALAWASDRWSRGPDAPMQFRPIQAVALLVAHLTGGAICPIGTGHGKTILSLLAADAMGARKPLLLIPPSMRVSFERSRLDYAKSFKLPPNLRVMAYSELSQAKNTDKLEKLQPDVIVCDEAHNLRNLDSARTKRVARYMKAHPQTKCVFMSGTLTSKSIKDYAALAKWALKAGSPVPHPEFYPLLQAYCAVLDAKPTKASGDSRYVCDAQDSDFAQLGDLFPDWYDYDPEPRTEDGKPIPSERAAKAREIFQDHLTHTPGVVGTDTASVGASFLCIKRNITPPPSITDHLARLADTWCRPDGEQYSLAIDVWRCGRQLTQGFYYRWVWPEGKVDKEWMTTRAAWHREVRRVVGRSQPHLDSPLLVTQAARRAVAGEPSPLADDYALLQALEGWEPHSRKRWGSKRTPPTEAVWVDEYLLDDAMKWVKDHPTGLVWYEEGAVADKLRERGMKVYGPNTNPEDIAGRHAAALSIPCHKDGKNLQQHSENLILSFSPSGTVMEQLVSRTHRSGQEADEVSLYYYEPTEPAANAVASACNNARYIQDTMKSPQRLCYADWTEE